MIIFPRILLCIAFLFQASKAFQTSALPSPSEEYVMRTWSISEGLPQSSVGCILQTRDGYLWVGTWNGLARFDGVRFTSFHSGNTPALVGSKINALHEDRHGRLWIATERGLVEFSGNRFVPVKTDGRARAVNAIAEDTQGTIWVGTDGGLFRIENSTLIFSGADHRELSSPIERLSVAGDGRMLIERSGRLITATLRQNGWSVDSVLPYLYHTIDDRGRVWFLDHDNVLYCKDETQTRIIHRFSARPTLWALAGGVIGLCFQDRLVLAGDAGMTNITRIGDGDLGENEVVYEDREGNLWLGRASSGLSRLRKKALTVLDERSGLSSATITSVLEDYSGTLWVGTYRKGLNYSRNKLFRGFTDLNVRDDAWIGLIWESADRSLWVSGPRMGLVRIDAGGGRRYVRGIINAETNVVDAGEGPDGGFWLATRSGGVQEDFRGRVTVWDTGTGLSSNETTCLLPAANGDVWVGTVAGLNRISGDTVTVMTVSNGLTHDDVQTLLEDDDGSIWIGTRRGLNRWKDGVLTGLSERHGLADDAISQMIDDGQGYFWFGGIKGLFRVLKTDLRDVADGRRALIRSGVYGTNAGLIVSEVGGGGNPRVARTRDGLLWFSSERGLIRLDPATIRANSVPPSVVIERATIDNQPVRADTLIVMNPVNSKVEFEYTGISFTAPERVRFQHRLIGFEEDWEDDGGRRFVQYTNLPPGEYTFQVRATNSDGVWNEKGASLAMVVIPPFWQTAWFLTLTVALFLLAGPSVYLLRVRILKREHARQQHFARQLIERQEDERKRISREMHDSLGQELLVLKHQIQLNLRKPGVIELKKETLEDFSNSVSGILDKARQISHDLRPPELDRLGLSETLRSILARVRDAGRFELVGEIDDIDGVFAKDGEIHIVRILQEALSNAMKHSQATRVSVIIRLEEDVITMKVIDNGKGMRQPVNGAGAGIGAMEERTTLLRGRIDIEPGEGRGTILSFRFPRTNANV